MICNLILTIIVSFDKSSLIPCQQLEWLVFLGKIE